MIGAWLCALGQLGDPRLRRPVVLGLLAAALVFAALVGFGVWLVGLAATGEGGWLDRLVSALGGVAAVLVAGLLFGPASLAVAGLLLEDVAAAVEARHYPFLAPATPASWWSQVVAGLRVALRVLVMSVLALPLVLVLPGIGSLLWLAVSAYALSREYFELAALRRMDAAAARTLRRRHRFRVWLAGLPAAALMLVPVANLFAPVLGAAAFTHVFHGVARDARRS
ncbi:EI24 domain-containing protein [Elioraea sp.]|uniref:EI24 domain-containing protein n=1 Tax=Elioraea sp. TaxID=2185103 RepID=UPI00307E8307